MERYKKIQNRKKHYNNYDNDNVTKSQVKKRYLIKKQKSKNKKYDMELKFNTNYPDIETTLCNCNSKWTYKYNYHDDNCKYKDKIITNNNIINKKNELFKSELVKKVIYNEYIFLKIIENLTILDIIILLRINKVLNNLIKENIKYIINHLSLKYNLNKQFIILLLYYNYDLTYNSFNNIINTLIDVRNNSYYYYNSKKHHKGSYLNCNGNCDFCKIHLNAFNKVNDFIIKKLYKKEIFDKKKEDSEYNGKFELSDYINYLDETKYDYFYKNSKGYCSIVRNFFLEDIESETDSEPEPESPNYNNYNDYEDDYDLYNLMYGTNEPTVMDEFDTYEEYYEAHFSSYYNK